MATYSTIQGLKLNSASDPFQLSDFIGNWNILDASPGTFICTSTSRPSWGAAQAGRMIFMNDLKQLSYWNGTSWNDLRDAAPVFSGGIFTNQTVNPGATPVYTVLTFTTSRPCSMAIWMTGAYGYPNNKFQDADQVIMFDGVTQEMGGFPDQIRFAGASTDTGTLARVTLPSLAVVPSVTAGQHKIGVQVQNGSQYPVSVVAIGFKVIGMIALYNSGNVL